MTSPLARWTGRFWLFALLPGAALATPPPAPDEPELLPRVVARWSNDRFALHGGDDLGFTQDASLEAHLIREADDLGLRVRQRLITERYGRRRTDEFTWQLYWLRNWNQGPLIWTYGPSATLALSGNYGGADLQNTFHETVSDGYTFDHGLADEYAPNRTGLVLGGRAGPSWLPHPWLRLLVGTELGVALGGTGRSTLALYDALEIESSPKGFRIAFSIGFDLERTWTRDPSLKLPGGYHTSKLYRVGHWRLALRGDLWEAGYRGEHNVGGAHTNLGTFYVLVGGGNAFRDEHAFR